VSAATAADAGQEPAPGARFCGMIRRAAFALVLAAAALPAAAPLRAQAPDLAPAKAAFAVIQAALDKPKGRPEWAKAREAVAALADPFQKRALLWRLAAEKDSGLRFPELAALLAETRAWPKTDAIRERAEAALGASERAEDVVAHFLAHPPRTGEGWRGYVAALSLLGLEEDAAAAARRAWRTAPMAEKDEAAFARAHEKTLLPADHAERVALYLRLGRTPEAARNLARLAADAPERPVLDLRLALRHGGLAPAEAEARRSKLPESQRADAWLVFDLATWHRRARRYAEAAALFAEAPAGSEHIPAWWREAERTARELLAEKKDREAYRAVATHRFAGGEGMATLEGLAGWIALRRLDDLAAAEKHFTRLWERSFTALTRARAAFWLSRVAKRRGDAAAAKDWLERAVSHPHYFYGQMAALELGRAALEFPADPSLSAEARAAFAAEELPRAAALFAAIGDGESARLLLLHLAQGAETVERHALVADLALGLERIEGAVRAGRRAGLRNAPLLGMSWPTPKLPEGVSVEPAFVYAIARQESEFHPGAVSPAGARGLMQLMPATAAEVARQMKLPYSRDKLTEDPVYNLRLGAHFLGQVTGRFDGAYFVAAAAYNAGPKRAEEWIARYGDPRKDVDPLDWIEQIPFEETRTYVQRVMENLVVYRHKAGTLKLVNPPLTLWRAP
jgi:soluble lytic murein transglycosylase